MYHAVFAYHANPQQGRSVKGFLIGNLRMGFGRGFKREDECLLAFEGQRYRYLSAEGVRRS